MQRARLYGTWRQGCWARTPPEPLKKNALEQTLTWDGKDDGGAPAESGPFKVRLRAGSAARLDRNVGWNGNTQEAGVVGLAVGTGGEVYVLFTSGHGRTSLRVFDKDGR